MISSTPRTYNKYQKGFRDLVAWQQAHKLALMVYRITQTFPKEERYGLMSQLQRAASSIGAQLAEGSRMQTLAHKKIYYERAYATAAETDNFLELAHDLHYITEKKYEELGNNCNLVSFLIHKLIQSCAPS